MPLFGADDFLSVWKIRIKSNVAFMNVIKISSCWPVSALLEHRFSERNCLNFTVRSILKVDGKWRAEEESTFRFRQCLEIHIKSSVAFMNIIKLW